MNYKQGSNGVHSILPLERRKGFMKFITILEMSNCSSTKHQRNSNNINENYIHIILFMTKIILLTVMLIFIVNYFENAAAVVKTNARVYIILK